MLLGLPKRFCKQNSSNSFLSVHISTTANDSDNVNDDNNDSNSNCIRSVFAFIRFNTLESEDRTFNETGRCLIKISSCFSNHTHSHTHLHILRQKNSRTAIIKRMENQTAPEIWCQTIHHAKLINRKVWAWTRMWMETKASKKVNAKR